VDGPKDIYFMSDVSGHVSASDFKETYGTSEAERVGCYVGYDPQLGRNLFEYKDLIPYGPDKRILKGYYLDSQTGTAKPCISNCLKCENGATCESCADRYYLDNQECKPCRDGCAECSEYEKCDDCDDGMEGDTCTCITGWFGTPGLCTKCSVNCVSCSGSGDHCEGHLQRWIEWR
jgi:hypothetical protein